MSAYSDTLYDKHKIKTSWADERIEDKGYIFVYLNTSGHVTTANIDTESTLKIQV